MPIAQFKPTAEPVTTPEPTKAFAGNYNGNIYDDNRVALDSLIAYVAGSQWTVQYFRQLVGKHSDLKELDINLDPVYQPYEKIEKMEIRVQSPLSSTTDTETQKTTTQGSGMIYPFLTPNKGDYFITDTSQNKAALFLITEVERRIFQDSSVHQVNYVLVDYVHNVPEMAAALERKATRTLVFSKERLGENLSPFLKEDTYASLQSLKVQYGKLAREYFHTFFQRSCYSLVLPGQIKLIYDLFIMEFLFSIVDSQDAPELSRIKRYGDDNDVFLNQPQFWTLLLERDYARIEISKVKVGLAHVKQFNNNSWIRGVYHGIVESLVYPVNPDTSYIVDSPSLNNGCLLDPKTTFDWELVPTTNYKGAQLLDNTYAMENRVINLYPLSLNLDWYVLTENFYSNTENMSALEILTKDYLKHQSLDLKMLQTLLLKYPELNRMQQFYYGPILLLLMKEVIRAKY